MRILISLAFVASLLSCGPQAGKKQTNHPKITAQNLEDYKALNSDDEQLQELSLEQVKSKYKDIPKSLIVEKLKLGHEQELSQEQQQSQDPDNRQLLQRAEIGECEIAIGHIVFDAISLVSETPYLRNTVSNNTTAEMFFAVEPSKSKIEEIFLKLASEELSLKDKAKAFQSLLRTISDAGMLKAVFKAYTKNLTWWEAVIFGVTSIGTITASLATDGAALIGEMLLEIASIGSFTKDIIDLKATCSQPAS